MKCQISAAKTLDRAGCRLEQTTDRPYQYAPAIKKVIGWNWRIQKQKHVIDRCIEKTGLSNDSTELTND